MATRGLEMEPADQEHLMERRLRCEELELVASKDRDALERHFQALPQHLGSQRGLLGFVILARP